MLQSHEFCDFYREVAVDGLEEDFSCTYALMLDHEAVGYAFGVPHGSIFCYLLFGCDYQRFGRHSPGFILSDAIIKDWIADGGDVFDFTVGDEEF